MNRFVLVLLIFLLVIPTAGFTAEKPWQSGDYIRNFINTFIPTQEAIGRMGIKGFFSLWGILSFLETHLPEGLDGQKYVVATRDLKTAIQFFKNDMIYLISEILGVRHIDREVLKIQIYDISQRLHVIVKTIQYVRRSLLKAAYYLFSTTINKQTIQKSDYQFSVTLNYLSTDNPWRGWLKRENLFRQIDIAEELELDYVKLNLFLDYWIFNRPKVREEFAQTVDLLRKRGFKIFLASEGINSYFSLDLSFADRKGDPNGSVNWITWKYQAALGIYEIVRLFKPEYVTVLKDPFVSLQEQMNQRIGVTHWVDFLVDVSRNIKRISPTTKVVVELSLASDNEIAFLTRVMELPEDNIVLGFMVYSIKDFFSIAQFLSSHPPTKEIIVAEIWDSVGLYVDELAEEFMKLGYLWSLDKPFKLFNVSYCVNLHTPLYKKTPAFHLYRNLITRGGIISENKEGIKASLDFVHAVLKWRGDEKKLQMDLPIKER